MRGKGRFMHKEIPETLCFRDFDLVRLTGLEPVRSPTRPSNVRVCLFRHNRANTFIIPGRGEIVKPRRL